MTTYMPAIEIIGESWPDLLLATRIIRMELDSGDRRFARIEWVPGDATLYRLVILPWGLVDGCTEYLVSLLGPGLGCYPFHTTPVPEYVAKKFAVTPYTATRLATFLGAWFSETAPAPDLPPLPDHAGTAAPAPGYW